MVHSIVMLFSAVCKLAIWLIANLRGRDTPNSWHSHLTNLRKVFCNVSWYRCVWLCFISFLLPPGSAARELVRRPRAVLTQSKLCGRKLSDWLLVGLRSLPHSLINTGFPTRIPFPCDWLVLNCLKQQCCLPPSRNSYYLLPTISQSFIHPFSPKEYRLPQCPCPLHEWEGWVSKQCGWRVLRAHAVW